jgi:hypothetical protein
MFDMPAFSPSISAISETPGRRSAAFSFAQLSLLLHPLATVPNAGSSGGPPLWPIFACPA